MRLNKNILLCLLLAGISVDLPAQFLGGIGQGASNIGLFSPIACTNFSGGTEDGYSTAYLGNPDSCGYYEGRLADGFATAWFVNPDSCRAFAGDSLDGAGVFFLPNPDSCGFFESSLADGGDVGFLASGIPCPSFFGSVADGQGVGFLSCAPLAVSASPLEGRMVEEDGYLWWYTFAEVNNLGFALERSLDQFNWQELGFLEGQDQSESLLKYEFYDRTMPKGLSYYRWRQIDFDGTTSFSNVVTLVKDGGNSALSFYLFPVPVESGKVLNFHLNTASEAPFTLKIVGLQGQVLLEREGKSRDGVFETVFATDLWTGGMYMLVVEQDGKRSTKRFVIY